MRDLVKLKADLFAGEGSVVFPDDWREHDAMLRADLLQDWMAALEKEYDRAWFEMRVDVEPDDPLPRC